MIIFNSVLASKFLGVVVSLVLGSFVEWVSSKNVNVIRSYIICLILALVGFIYGAETKSFDPIKSGRNIAQASNQFKTSRPQNKILIIGDSFAEDFLMLAEHNLNNKEKIKIKFLHVLSNCAFHKVKYRKDKNASFDYSRCKTYEQKIDNLIFDEFDKIVIIFDWKAETLQFLKTFLASDKVKNLSLIHI